MKMLRFLPAIALLVVFGCESPASPDVPLVDLVPAFNHVPAGPTSVNFESFADGADVSNPHPFLNIASLDGHDVLAIWDEYSGNYGGTVAYGAWEPAGGSSRINGCLTDGAGFGLFPQGTERHQLQFTFLDGATASDFSMRVLDYGDRIGIGEGTTHRIVMRAYSGGVEVDAHVVEDTWSGIAAGDACDPVGSTQYGLIDLSVAAAGIDRVDVFMELGGDRLTGYDDVSFTLEPHDPATKDDCRKGGWAEYGFRNQGQCVRFIETGKDSRPMAPGGPGTGI